MLIYWHASSLHPTPGRCQQRSQVRRCQLQFHEADSRPVGTIRRWHWRHCQKYCLLLKRELAVLFGSSDTCFLGSDNGQHVPLEEYKTNMGKILTHSAVQSHNPRLILVSGWGTMPRERVRSQGYAKLNRSNVVTKSYADASWEVAKNLEVACLVLWTAFMTKAGWKPGDHLYGSMNLPENDVIRGLIHGGTRGLGQLEIVSRNNSNVYSIAFHTRSLPNI